MQLALKCLLISYWYWLHGLDSQPNTLFIQIGGDAMKLGLALEGFLLSKSADGLSKNSLHVYRLMLSKSRRCQMLPARTHGVP